MVCDEVRVYGGRGLCWGEGACLVGMACGDGRRVCSGRVL